MKLTKVTYRENSIHFNGLNPEIHNLDPEGLDPYSKEKPTCAMIKYATYSLSRIDPWSERSMMVQRRTERLPEVGRSAPRRPLGPR